MVLIVQSLRGDQPRKRFSEIQFLGHCIVIVIIFTVFLTPVYTTKLEGVDTEKKLFKDVFDGIDPRVRPVANISEAVEIKIDLTPLYMKGIDEPNQEFMMYAWIALGIDKVHVKADTIWVPDIGMINSAIHLYKDVFEPDKYRATVESSGRARVAYSGDLHSICILDVTYFPFEHQICHVEFDSWTLDKKRALFRNDSHLYIEQLRSNGLWSVEDTYTVFTEEFYAAGNEIFRTISFVFRLKRKPNYILFNVVLPCFILFVLEVLVFVIPAEAGEKVSLGITLMLAITVFQLIIAEHLPATSDYFPIMTLYLVGIMVLSAIALLFTVIVINVHHRDPELHPLPSWIRKVVLQKLAPILFIKTQNSAPQNNSKENGKDKLEVGEDREASTLLSSVGDNRNDWELVARVLDRLFMIIYIVLALLLTLGTFLTCTGAELHRDKPLGGYGYMTDKYRP